MGVALPFSAQWLMTHITDLVTPDTPLRLSDAARIAFPRGGMTASGLRREAKRGRLVIERVAGKDYTTLNHIKRMRELCHVQQTLPDCGSGRPGAMAQARSLTLPSGLSSMEVASMALDAVLTTVAAQSKR